MDTENTVNPLVMSQYHGTLIARENAAYIECIDDWILTDDIPEAGYVWCAHNEAYIEKSNATYIECLDAWILTDDIPEAGYVWCAHSEVYIDESDSVLLPNGDYVHENCLLSAGFGRCEHYNTIHELDDLSEIDGSLYCQRYLDNYCYYCENCNTYRHCDDQCDCQDEEDEDEDTRVNPYNHKPAPKFFDARTPTGSPWTHAKLAYVGYELEFELCNNSREYACDVIERSALYKSGKLYLKQDGSLDDGIEIVSHPLDPKAENWGHLRDLCKALLKIGCKSYEPGTCGIHVHVSRLVDPLGSKLEIIVDRLEWYLKALSKRTDYKYCAFPSRCPDRTERYRAVNHLNPDTLELRFFRGTLNPQSAVNSIKTCYELAQFAARSSESHLKQATRDQILREFRAGLPPYLLAWCDNRANGKLSPDVSPHINKKLLTELGE